MNDRVRRIIEIEVLSEMRGALRSVEMSLRQQIGEGVEKMALVDLARIKGLIEGYAGIGEDIGRRVAMLQQQGAPEPEPGDDDDDEPLRAWPPQPAEHG